MGSARSQIGRNRLVELRAAINAVVEEEIELRRNIRELQLAVSTVSSNYRKTKNDSVGPIQRIPAEADTTVIQLKAALEAAEDEERTLIQEHEELKLFLELSDDTRKTVIPIRILTIVTGLTGGIYYGPI